MRFGALKPVLLEDGPTEPIFETNHLVQKRFALIALDLLDPLFHRTIPIEVVDELNYTGFCSVDSFGLLVF